MILAGVYDIKNIKLKMISEGTYAPAEAEDKLYNSPWNIAADFRVDMSFDPSEIATMLINGKGFYHIESQFTDLRSMDIVMDFAREQFIIELKLWRGEAEHDKAYEQLVGYMDSIGFAEGYLLTFDFRKNANKQPYTKWVDYDGKRIFDVVV